MCLLKDGTQVFRVYTKHVFLSYLHVHRMVNDFIINETNPFDLRIGQTCRAKGVSILLENNVL